MRKKKAHAAARAEKAGKRKRRKVAEAKQSAKREKASHTPPEHERVVLPPPKILMPMTQFERRMARLSRGAPPPPHLQTPAFRAHFQKVMDSDLAFQIRWKKFAAKAPLWAYTRRFGGSGFVMAETIRQFFLEYWDRVIKHGPHSYPTSFNVVESFLKFDSDYCAFDLRHESEHLLDATEYFRWYSANAALRKPALLLDVMREAVVYSYNMVGDSGGYRIISGEVTRVLAGVSFVRHGNELSCILLAGEQPPTVPDSEIDPKHTAMIKSLGREGILPDPALGIADRYLQTFPGFARVLVLTRIDLARDKFDVRYVNIDVGTGYRVLTDDEEVFDDMPGDEAKRWLSSSLESLRDYEELFSLLTSLLYVPLLYVDAAGEAEDVVFKTELSVKRTEPWAVKAAKVLGEKECVFERTVRCLPCDSSPEATVLKVTPPELKFEATGFWRPLDPGMIGEDEKGKPIVGKTWVERTDNWSSKSSSSFVLRRKEKPPEGPNPGVIYVVRTPANEIDVYKVGLTTRTAEERAKELNSTGVALPFGILAKWDVGDCIAIEKEVHRRLSPRRVSDRREFFRAPLQEIIATIDKVVAGLEPRKAL